MVGVSQNFLQGYYTGQEILGSCITIGRCLLRIKAVTYHKFQMYGKASCRIRQHIYRLTNSHKIQTKQLFLECKHVSSGLSVRLVYEA